MVGTGGLSVGRTLWVQFQKCEVGMKLGGWRSHAFSRKCLLHFLYDVRCNILCRGHGFRESRDKDIHWLQELRITW